MKVYFAHPKSHNGTPLAAEEFASILRTFPDAEVISPYEYVVGYDGFEQGYALIDQCDIIAVAPFLDGSLDMRVFREMFYAVDTGKPVYGTGRVGCWPVSNEALDAAVPLSIAASRNRIRAGVQ